ncbi:MAG TPA: hypothetical protein VFG47_06775 [Geminicoccaceae bacterium]|nr:hypothetical protein [Geminicoccaceae bacterium]
MSRLTGSAAVAVLAAALVGACTGTPTIYNRQVLPNYTVAEYAYGAGRRDLYTFVRGDPFGMGDAAFEGAVIDALNRHPPLPQPTRFTATPGESARPPYRTVVLFGAPPAVLPNALCRLSYDESGPVPVAAPAAAENGTLRAAAAFCRGAGALTTATGQVEGVESVADPGFDALISQLVLALFPLENMDRDRGRCRPATAGDC